MGEHALLRRASDNQDVNWSQYFRLYNQDVSWIQYLGCVLQLDSVFRG